jgi:Predicted acetyltransferase
MDILRIQDHRELAEKAALWFHRKWDIPESAYRESMEDCLKNTSAVPQWYVVMEGEEIIAGMGVIENDFHDRKDLTPNVCAVYVEEAYRNRGIAGEMLRFVCEEFAGNGIDTLYLVTDHTAFYERYGWEFMCMVKGAEGELTRMYIHRGADHPEMDT